MLKRQQTDGIVTAIEEISTFDSRETQLETKDNKRTMIR